MGAIIPLLLALLATELLRHQPGPAATWQAMLGALAGAILLWLLVAEGVARMVAWRGNRRWLRHWEDQAAQVLALGLFAWLCYDRGWAAWAPGYTLAIMPWVVFQCVLWWTLAPAVRAATDSGWTRNTLVLHHLRFELAPLLIALPVIDLCIFAGDQLGTTAWCSGYDQILLGLLGGCLLVAGVMALLPAFLIRLWGARPLPPGPLAEALTVDCIRAGLPGVRLMTWGTPGGKFRNAVALGIAPFPRWVMLSSDLMHDLPLEQVRAVVGHELGHHRHGHLRSYLWFAIAANLALGSLLQLLVGSADAAGRPLPPPFSDPAPVVGAVFQLPGVDQLPPLAVIAVTVIALVLLLWYQLFGVLSRASERQADIAGAELAGPEHMAGALRAVARLANTPEDAPSWRHRPIAERIAFLNELAASPRIAQDHHRLVRDMRLLIIASLALLVALAAVALRFDPRRELGRIGDPAARIQELAKADQTLADALATADGGDTRQLIGWLHRAEPADRIRFALLHLRQVELSGGKDAEGKPLPMDDRSIYRLRWRFSALDVVTFEPPDDELNLAIDNTLAYGLVAGTQHPTPRDIELARGVLPRLEAAMLRTPDHGVWDTIGCVRFASGEWDAARKAFAKALELAASDERQAERAAAESLYGRRRQAAQQNAAAAARGSPLQPLPLSFLETPPQ